MLAEELVPTALTLSDVNFMLLKNSVFCGCGLDDLRWINTKLIGFSEMPVLSWYEHFSDFDSALGKM
jgi:hypothetical protein